MQNKILIGIALVGIAGFVVVSWIGWQTWNRKDMAAIQSTETWETVRNSVFHYSYSRPTQYDWDTHVFISRMFGGSSDGETDLRTFDKTITFDDLGTSNAYSLYCDGERKLCKAVFNDTIRDVVVTMVNTYRKSDNDPTASSGGFNYLPLDAFRRMADSFKFIQPPGHDQYRAQEFITISDKEAGYSVTYPNFLTAPNVDTPGPLTLKLASDDISETKETHLDDTSGVALFTLRVVEKSMADTIAADQATTKDQYIGPDSGGGRLGKITTSGLEAYYEGGPTAYAPLGSEKTLILSSQTCCSFYLHDDSVVGNWKNLWWQILQSIEFS